MISFPLHVESIKYYKLINFKKMTENKLSGSGGGGMKGKRIKGASYYV